MRNRFSLKPGRVQHFSIEFIDVGGLILCCGRVRCCLLGITNHDEYSLFRENTEDEMENKPNFGTLTLKRRKEEKERDMKMEQLKKKFKTDDECNFPFFFPRHHYTLFD